MHFYKVCIFLNVFAVTTATTLTAAEEAELVKARTLHFLTRTIRYTFNVNAW